MTLNEYLKEEHGRGRLVARMIGKSPAFVSQMAAAQRPVPPLIANQIEMATGGRVTRRELRPDDFHLIWPDLQSA
jgi:DNA-binding transcriptional regulator YdaS (Cro superfamily)